MTVINFTVVLSVVLALFSKTVSACVSGSCSSGMCSDIPANNQVVRLIIQYFFSQTCLKIFNSGWLIIFLFHNFEFHSII